MSTSAKSSSVPPRRANLIGVGTQGDRASVIFGAPDEISLFIKRQC